VPRSPHSGVDVEAGPNEIVRAANAGTVVLAAELYLSGNTVVIDHGLGLFTNYCHFSRILVKSGDAVRKGDPIGRVGSTGRSTGPHLHWGVRIFESRVDPDSILGFRF
jgi:murein DD-endopeptidase MepM/ murein hydrolase activator NlpD